MQRVYADSLSSSVSPLNFDIPISVDDKLDCDNELKIQYEDEFE
jgi:hypothetical protein